MKMFKSTFLLSVSAVLTCASMTADAASQTAVRVIIDAQAYPHAKCNDDTPATYYLRGAGQNGEVSGKKWLIFLHGGGSCASDDECAERWYDPDADADGKIGFHGNMTASMVATKNFNGEGILDFDGVDDKGGSNPFTGFNRIMVPYCSSDGYSGKNMIARPVDYAAYVGTAVMIDGKEFKITNPGNFPPLTAIRFSGRYIVEAIVDILMSGGIKTGLPGGDSLGYVPSSATDEILISGSSAGGGGVAKNLDNIAAIVHGYASDVKVYGVIDGADGVGLLPDAQITGESGFAAAEFYNATQTSEVDASCQIDYPIAASHKCFDGTFLLKNYIETPYFVIQQAYDSVIHANMKTFIEQQLAGAVPPATAEALAVQYIRNRISEGARGLGAGVADPQHIGYFVANYVQGKHQLMVEDKWFFNSPLAYLRHGGADPRLGADDSSTLSIPRALACFRYKVTGEGTGCEQTGDSKVINSTYPTNPFLATYEAQSSTLTLPYLRLSNNLLFKDVVIFLSSLGNVVVGDTAAGELGSANEYMIAGNILLMPFVEVSGTVYEKVSLTGAGFSVLSYEAVTF